MRSDMGPLPRTTRSTQVARTEAIELTRTKILNQAGSPKRKGTGPNGGGDGTGGTGGRRKSRGTAGAAAASASANFNDEGSAATAGAKAAKQDDAEKRKVARKVLKAASSTCKPGFRVGMPGNVRPVSLTVATTRVR